MSDACQCPAPGCPAVAPSLRACCVSSRGATAGNWQDICGASPGGRGRHAPLPVRCWGEMPGRGSKVLGPPPAPLHCRARCPQSRQTRGAQGGHSVQASWGFIGASASAFTPDPREIAGLQSSPGATTQLGHWSSLQQLAWMGTAHPIIMPNAAFSVSKVSSDCAHTLGARKSLEVWGRGSGPNHEEEAFPSAAAWEDRTTWYPGCDAFLRCLLARR